MPAHVREQIAAAALGALTGLATTGARVFRDRDTEASPLEAAELPGLVLEDDGDPAETVSLGAGRVLERRMRLTVTAHVKALAGYSATLNEILRQVEVALAGAALGGAKAASLVEVGARELSEAGEAPAVRQAFVFEFLYYTAHHAPDVAL